MELLKTKEEGELKFSILNYSIFYNQQQLDKFLNNLTQDKRTSTRKNFKIKIDGNTVGVLQLPFSNNLEETKNVLENFLQEKIKFKDPNQERSHIIEIVYLPEPEEKHEAPLALHLYAESSNHQKEFENMKFKGEEEKRKIAEVEKGYLIISSSSMIFPAETLSGFYTQINSQEKNVYDVLDKISNPKNKDVYLTLTIEDATKMEESQKIKENIQNKYQDRFHTLLINFKVLTTMDIEELISLGVIKENYLSELKNGLILASDKTGNPTFNKEEQQMILNSKNSEGLIKTLEILGDREIYFSKKLMEKNNLIEHIFTYFRKINAFETEKKLNLNISSDGVLSNPQKETLNIYNPSLQKEDVVQDSKIVLSSYLDQANLDKEQYFEIKRIDGKLIYKCVYVPKEVNENLMTW